MSQINCFKSNLDKFATQEIKDVLNTGDLGFGPLVAEFENKMATRTKKKYNIGLNSASSAAYIIYQMLYEKCGPCRVYTTSLGFVSPVWAAIKNGHEVVFVDVDENLLFDVWDFQNKFVRDEKTSVVMPVLYGGVTDVPDLHRVSKSLGCLVVVDSAHCIDPKLKSDYTFLSFHPVKPISMASGGLLSTDIEEHSEYFLRCRNFGRESINDSYDLVQSGFNFYMNNINAALGLSSLETCDIEVEKRKSNFEKLKSSLSELGTFIKHDSGSSYYLATLNLRKDLSSSKMRQFLKSVNIGASYHYPMIHNTEYYKTNISLKNTEKVEDQLINLPIHHELNSQQIERIINECIHYSRSGS